MVQSTFFQVGITVTPGWEDHLRHLYPQPQISATPWGSPTLPSQIWCILFPAGPGSVQRSLSNRTCLRQHQQELTRVRSWAISNGCSWKLKNSTSTTKALALVLWGNWRDIRLNVPTVTTFVFKQTIPDSPKQPNMFCWVWRVKLVSTQQIFYRSVLSLWKYGLISDDKINK